MTEDKHLDIGFQKRFSKNLLSNIIYFILSIIVGLALVPFFLDTLGESAYGLVPLATSLTSYVTLFIDGVNESISRYLTIDLQQGRLKKAITTYNTALFGTMGILILMIPIGIVAAIFSPTFFEIGTANPTDVMLLFGLILASVYIRAWSSNFMVTLFAYNRLDMRNYINNLNLLVQVVAVVILFAVSGPTLPNVGMSYLIASVAALILAVILSKRVCPSLHVSATSFSFSHLKEIVSVSLWIVLAKLGVVLRSQLALMIVNVMFGTIAGTEYSLVLTWNTLIISIISLITSCFVPMSYSYRAKDDKEGLTRFTKFTVKVVTLATALLVGLVSIFAGQLMKIWVGAEYADLAMLVCVVIIGCIFAVQSSCCSAINAAYLRVRFPAFANLVAGVVNIILALALPRVFDMGIYGVAIATTLATLLLSGFLSPMNGAYILKVPLFTFIKPAIAGYIALIILIISGRILTSIISIDGILLTFISGGSIAILYTIIVWCFVIKKEERKIVLAVIPTMISSKIPKLIREF